MCNKGEFCVRFPENQPRWELRAMMDNTSASWLLVETDSISFLVDMGVGEVGEVGVVGVVGEVGDEGNEGEVGGAALLSMSGLVVYNLCFARIEIRTGLRSNGNLIKLRWDCICLFDLEDNKAEVDFDFNVLWKELRRRMELIRMGDS